MGYIFGLIGCHGKEIRKWKLLYCNRVYIGLFMGGDSQK